MRLVASIPGSYRCTLRLRDRYVRVHRHPAVRIILMPAIPIYLCLLLLIHCLLAIQGQATRIIEGESAANSGKILSKLANLYIKITDSVNLLYLDEEFYHSLLKFANFTSNLFILFSLIIEMIFSLIVYLLLINALVKII